MPLWQGSGVCPVREDDGASHHVAIDASAQTIGSAPSLSGRVDPVHCDGEAPTEVHLNPVPRDLIVAASKRTPAEASTPAPSLASNAGKVCIPGLTTTREVCPRCSASLTVALQRRPALHHHGGAAVSGETPLCEAVWPLQH